MNIKQAKAEYDSVKRTNPALLHVNRTHLISQLADKPLMSCGNLTIKVAGISQRSFK